MYNFLSFIPRDLDKQICDYTYIPPTMKLDSNINLNNEENLEIFIYTRNKPNKPTE